MANLREADFILYSLDPRAEGWRSPLTEALAVAAHQSGESIPVVAQAGYLTDGGMEAHDTDAVLAFKEEALLGSLALNARLQVLDANAVLTLATVPPITLEGSLARVSETGQFSFVNATTLRHDSSGHAFHWR